MVSYKFGLWRIRTASGKGFIIPARNDGISSFEIPEGSFEFVGYLDDETGEQQERILATMMTRYWEYKENHSSTPLPNLGDTEV